MQDFTDYNFAKRVLQAYNRSARRQGYNMLMFARSKACKVVSATAIERSRYFSEVPDIQKESTYDQCVFAQIYCDSGDEKIQMELDIFNGDLLRGSPTDRRCCFKLEVLDVTEIAKVIKECYTRLIEEEFDRIEAERLALVKESATRIVNHKLLEE